MEIVVIDLPWIILPIGQWDEAKEFLHIERLEQREICVYFIFRILVCVLVMKWLSRPSRP